MGGWRGGDNVVAGALQGGARGGRAELYCAPIHAMKPAGRGVEALCSAAVPAADRHHCRMALSASGLK